MINDVSALKEASEVVKILLDLPAEDWSTKFIKTDYVLKMIEDAFEKTDDAKQTLKDKLGGEYPKLFSDPPLSISKEAHDTFIGVLLDVEGFGDDQKESDDFKALAEKISEAILTLMTPMKAAISNETLEDMYEWTIEDKKKEGTQREAITQLLSQYFSGLKAKICLEDTQISTNGKKFSQLRKSKPKENQTESFDKVDFVKGIKTQMENLHISSALLVGPDKLDEFDLAPVITGLNRNIIISPKVWRRGSVPLREHVKEVLEYLARSQVRSNTMKLQSMYYVLESLEERQQFNENFLKPVKDKVLSDDDLNYLLSVFVELYDQDNQIDIETYRYEFSHARQCERERVYDFYNRLRKLYEKVYRSEMNTQAGKILLTRRLCEGLRDRRLAIAVSSDPDGYRYIYVEGDVEKLLNKITLNEKILREQDKFIEKTRWNKER